MLPPPLFLLLLLGAFLASACYQGNTGGSLPAITIGQPTYVCIVINDRYLGVALPIADTYSRLIVNGSSLIASDDSTLCESNPFWYPLQCATTPQILGGLPATNYYITSGGKVINYKKTYVYPDNSDGTFVFPITTAVISVSNGIVQSVFWDDGCYFCPSDAAPSDPACPDGLYGCEQCKYNAYNLNDNNAALINNTDPNSGSDCAINTISCTTPALGSHAVLPSNFCDLAVYIVWTGTDAAGIEFSSAGRRFRRFRAYGMQTQLAAMQGWSPAGNSLTPSPPPSSPGSRVLGTAESVPVVFPPV